MRAKIVDMKRLNDETVMVSLISITNKLRSRELTLSDEQWNSWIYGSYLIQDCFPQLTSSEREFLLTGLDDEEWEELTNEG